MQSEALSTLWIEAEELARTLALMPEARQRMSRTEKIWFYRPYEGGEEMTRIDWRQSARGDRLFVREAENIRTRPVYLWSGDAPRGFLIAAALGFMLLRADRAVGWMGPAIKPTKTAALWRETMPPESLPPETLPSGQATLALFPDENESWPKRLKDYAGQGLEGIVVANETVFSALRQTAQTIGWPLFKVPSQEPPEKTLLAAFTEMLRLSV